MYRVMIVDDEVAIREKIPQIIQFEEYGFSVCGTAKNGREALEQLSELRPDLVLLDMRMPVLDGLGFLEELRRGEFADTKVIILSGYSDFSYAKKAMRFGASEYLTKPVDEDEAHLLLSEIAKELVIRDAERSRTDLRRQLNRLDGFYHGSGMAEGFSDFLLLFVVLLSVRVPGEDTNPHQLMMDCLSGELGKAEDFLFRVRGSVYSCLLPISLLEQQGEEVFGRRFLKKLEERGLECAVMLDKSVFTAGGTSFRQNYADHLYAMLTDVFYGRRNVVCYPPESLKSGEEALVPEDPALSALRDSLTGGARELVFSRIEHLIAEVARVRPRMEQIQELNYRIYYLLLGVMQSVMNSREQEPILQPPEWRDSPSFLTMERWAALRRQQVADAYDFIERCRKMSHLGVCGEVLEYIHHHFSEQISIKQVAEHFYMNPAYLGRVFQKAIGSSFNQYLNNLRLAEAKRLLTRTDKLVYEIAELSGFSESKYFISRFTKEVGMSPSEYRRENG